MKGNQLNEKQINEQSISRKTKKPIGQFWIAIGNFLQHGSTTISKDPSHPWEVNGSCVNNCVTQSPTPKRREGHDDGTRN